MTTSLFSIALALGVAMSTDGESALNAPILHTLRFPAAARHYVDVETRVPNPNEAELEIAMPVWTPGSYLIREYSRRVEDLAAADETGAALALSKLSKNRWRVHSTGVSAVRLTYRLYGREMSVRTNFIDRDFAMLLGAATFFQVEGAAERELELRIEPPAGWTKVVVPLPEIAGAGLPTYRVASFERLADSPIYAGSAGVSAFEIDGVPHTIVHQDGSGLWDIERSTADAARITRAQAEFWRGLPYERFVIFNLLGGDGGGLEHANGTVLMSSPWQGRTRKDYLDWLSLTSHEVFHAWNGKRLRPVELGPFDYEREAYTRSLWVVEGLTSYFDDLLVHRAGLSTREEYLQLLSKQIERLQETPGRLRQSLSMASFDTWIKFYRPDESSANTSVSYYTKGALVGWLLDVEIRRATEGARSLDDALRLAYSRYSGSRGYTQEELRTVLSEVAGRDLTPQLQRWLDVAEELEWEVALEWFGLRFKPIDAPKPGEPPPAWLGMESENRQGALVVTKVLAGGPAQTAGLNVDDEILAFDGYRVTAASLEDRLKAFRPGGRIEITVARRERLRTLELVAGEKPAERWKLEVNPAATEAQRARLDAWLGAAAQP